jgi:bacterial/archaeal transporter family-2 protein
VATVEARPRGAAALIATPARAVAMVILAGGAISLQSYVNGRLGKDVGSPTIAAAVNNLVATVATLAIVLATGALPRALARVRALGRPPAWQFLGGFGGAALVLVSAVAAPEVGVALLTVALVCGSIGGSLPVDAAGIGPAGKRAITPLRVVGVLLAVGATVIGALGSRGDLQPLLLTLALVAGIGMALQAAANGQLARATGEPFVASLMNVTVGFVVLGVVAIITLATTSLDGLPASPQLYIGGLLGGFVVVVSAAAVQTLGVLRLGLATVAGQTAGALVIDLIAPAPGEAVTLGTLIGVALTMAAVAISGRGLRVAPVPAAHVEPGRGGRYP